MRRLHVLMMLFLVLVFLAGCMPAMGPQPDYTNPIKRLAMLPLKNDTTDVDAPNFVREKLAAAIERPHFKRPAGNHPRGAAGIGDDGPAS